MNVVLPILIIAALGCCSGLLVKRWVSSRWKSAFGGAGIATTVWVGGIYIWFWLFAPNESIRIHLGGVSLTFLIALASAAVAVWVFTKQNQSNGVKGTDAGPT